MINGPYSACPFPEHYRQDRYRIEALAFVPRLHRDAMTYSQLCLWSKSRQISLSTHADAPHTAKQRVALAHAGRRTLPRTRRTRQQHACTERVEPCRAYRNFIRIRPIRRRGRRTNQWLWPIAKAHPDPGASMATFCPRASGRQSRLTRSISPGSGCITTSSSTEASRTRSCGVGDRMGHAWRLMDATSCHNFLPPLPPRREL
ncbi:hypothetical protein OBBRIDRAFT_496201 [Obba rivulosa]|uniref:Uncharacterized protein n=1 Tax=Obba rivulosa TaxID=1052685 RepID=A0A8E2DIH1_9APHY|nr:hypothetical protein OBBRIDRAFT_496201 [Obba rivulosa]